ncbi:MAG: hypothetical protein K1X78_11585 [Verrucomicrobiaceae bacterium]|nr:hypothetical protein [Verrucomicrobiaceae bacterium]
MPNFIREQPEPATRRNTFSLSNVPLTHVIGCLALLSGAKALHGRHAMIFSPVAD